MDAGPGERRFRAELGSNRYWRVAVGTDETREQSGADLLAEPSWVSPISGPVEPRTLGRITFAIEEERFDRDNRFVQIMTYRDAQGNGPAVSRIVEAHQAGLPAGGLAPIQFSHASSAAMDSRNYSHQTSAYAYGHTAREPARLTWEPASRSSQMALPAIPAIIGMVGPLLAKAAPLLKGALPHLVNAAAPIAQQVIGSLLNGGAGGGAMPVVPPITPPAAHPPVAVPRAAPIAPPAAPVAASPAAAPAPAGGARNAAEVEVVSLLLERLTELAQAQRSNSQSVAAHRAGRYGRYATGKALRKQMASRASRPMRKAARRGSAFAAQTTLSSAQAAPVAALLPILTKLAPMLQQVMTPETVQSVLNAPREHLQTVFNGMKDMARLGIDSHQQDLDFLKAINPGVEDPGLDALIAGLSLSASRMDHADNWKRAESVSLRMSAVRTVPVAGQLVTLLAADRPLRFPLEVTLPTDSTGRSPSLKGAKVQLRVKDKSSLEVLHAQEWDAGDISGSGPLSIVPAVSPSALAGLPRGAELLFCFALVWNNSKGEARGAPVQHLARLSEGYSFERLVQSQDSAPVQLMDEGQFGDYHHIVWSNRFRDDARRVLGELNYFYVLAEDDMPLHRRLEPEFASRGVERTPTRRELRMRSGFEVSLDALVRLGSILDPSSPPIDPVMRGALSDMNFRSYFDRSARLVFDFRSAPEETFAMRVIPTMAMHDLVLHKQGDVDEFGQVVSSHEVRVKLPVPVSVDLHIEDPSAAPGSDPRAESSAVMVPTRMTRRTGTGGGD